jgi:hypothetical protein
VGGGGEGEGRGRGGGGGGEGGGGVRGRGEGRGRGGERGREGAGGGEGGSSQGRISKPVLGHRLGQRDLVTQLVFVGLFVPRNGCGCKGGGRGLSRFGGAALAVRLVSRLEGAGGRSHFAHACRKYTVAGGTRLQRYYLCVRSRKGYL